jgi:hypothetical protein
MTIHCGGKSAASGRDDTVVAMEIVKREFLPMKSHAD